MSKVDKKKSLRKIKQFFKKTLKGKQIEEGDRLLKSLEDFSKSPRQLAINTLSLSDAMDIFGLTEDPNSEQVWALSNEELLEIPNSLYKALESTGRTLGRDPQNEEACRWRINDIMKDIIIQEQIYSCTHSAMSAVFLVPETYLARTVIFKGEERLLLDGTVLISGPAAIDSIYIPMAVRGKIIFGPIIIPPVKALGPINCMTTPKIPEMSSVGSKDENNSRLGTAHVYADGTGKTKWKT